jgi:D-lactate dehydrogenase
MTKPQIAFYDVHSLDQETYRQHLSADYDLIMCEEALSEANVGLAKAAQILCVHASSPVTAGLMGRIPGLKHVACRTTGYDHVDLKYAQQHGIAVTNVPNYGQETVAEYTFLLLLAVSRKLMKAAHSVHARQFVPTKLTGSDLQGKTLGVIGTGRIGRHVIRIAKGFGMKVVAYDVKPHEAAAAGLGFSYVKLAELLAASDCLTLHAPGTAGNRHLLAAEQFALMKPGVLVVNTARGSLIDTVALIEALNSGQVGGAGLDVLEGEENTGLEAELHLLGEAELGDEAREILGINILHTMPNVLITSHNAYNSKEALERIRDTTIGNILAYTSHKPVNKIC